MADNVKIELTKDEALVLFDFLGRFNQTDHSDIFEHQAEKIVLWNVEAVLESTLAEPFMLNYDEIIKQSRDKFHDEN